MSGLMSALDELAAEGVDGLDAGATLDGTAALIAARNRLDAQIAAGSGMRSASRRRSGTG